MLKLDHDSAQVKKFIYVVEWQNYLKKTICTWKNVQKKYERDFVIMLARKGRCFYKPGYKKSLDMSMKLRSTSCGQ